MPTIPSQITNPYQKSFQDVLTELKVRLDVGLPSNEALSRNDYFGLNILPNTRQYVWLTILLDRFKDPLLVILILAGFVSLFLGYRADAVIIFIAITADVSMHFFQRYRTERTIQDLQSRIKNIVTVIRDGRQQKIISTHLTIGDIIEIHAGENMAVDARLIQARGLRVSQATLTGESIDIHKETTSLSGRLPTASQKNMVFAGTSITSGSATAVVTAIGSDTEFGKIAHAIAYQPETETPARRALTKISITTGLLLFVAVSFIVLVAFVRNIDIVITLRTALTLIVSAIPEDLTLIFTLALVIGMVRILKKGGVVKNLASAETLGETTVICTDKTGTLTHGKITAKGFDFLQGSFMATGSRSKDANQELILQALALANAAYNSHGYVGSAVERAVLQFVDKSLLSHQNIRQQWKVTHAIHFNPTLKYRVVVATHPTQGNSSLFVVGAPDILLEQSSSTFNEHFDTAPISSEKRTHILRSIEQHGQHGYHMLGVAVKNHVPNKAISQRDIHGLKFLGILLLEDPVRETVHKSLAEIIYAGVAVKLITGDHLATAQAVARKVGLRATSDESYTGNQLRHMDDKDVLEIIDHATIFARIEPLDKKRIIRLLQAKGHIVAMTGDGINDAVALKSADIGVAMGSGTDIAKDAADLILLSNSFSTIVSAIKEGRVMKANLQKVILFLLSTNLAEVAIFIGSILLGLPLPLLPAQILWINIVTDGTSDLALCFEREEGEEMKTNPSHGLISPSAMRSLLFHIFYCGLIMTATSLAFFAFLVISKGVDLTYARTMTFATIATSSLLSAWSFRSLRRPLWATHKSNPFLYASAGFSFLLQLAAIYVPFLQGIFTTVAISFTDWVPIILVSIIAVMLIETRKWFLPQQARKIKQAVLPIPTILPPNH